MLQQTIRAVQDTGAVASLDGCPTRYPSIQTLKAFEAVARLKSFTRAAEELFLTQSAVTHQVRALEEYLNARLFCRRPRGVELTDAGDAIYEGVTMGLLIIGRSLNEVRQ